MGTREGDDIVVIQISHTIILYKRAFYPHAQEVLITEALLAPLRQVATQGQQSAFLVESKTNPKKEVTFSNQPLCFRTDSTISHHLQE